MRSNSKTFGDMLFLLEKVLNNELFPLKNGGQWKFVSLNISQMPILKALSASFMKSLVELDLAVSKTLIVYSKSNRC